MAIARDGTNVQNAYKSFGDQRGFETVRNREADAERTVQEVLELLKAPKVDGGVYTVILDPKLAGVFIHEAFGHLSEADHIARNEQLRKIMTLGARFGGDELAATARMSGDLAVVAPSDLRVVPLGMLRGLGEGGLEVRVALLACPGPMSRAIGLAGTSNKAAVGAVVPVGGETVDVAGFEEYDGGYSVWSFSTSVK